MDWNWFFSSFSQCAAALLGIIGAFIISRLIGIEDKVNRVFSDFEELKIKFGSIRESLAIRRPDWHNETIVRYDADLIEKVKNGEFEGLNRDEILNVIYEQDDRLFKSDDAIIKGFEDLYNKYKPAPRTTNSQDQIFVVKQPTSFTIDVPPDGTWPRINQERDKINECLIEAGENISKFFKNYSEYESYRSSLKIAKFIVSVLIFSFPIIVIYPLHFMPLGIGTKPSVSFSFYAIISSLFSIRGFLLFMFFVAVECIFIYFLIFISNIKTRLKNLKSSYLPDYTNIKAYCPYYREQEE